MDRKKILFISQYFPPDITAAAFRISETAKLMADKGFYVKVLTAKPHRGEAVSNKKNNINNCFPESKVMRAPIFELRNIGKGKLKYTPHFISFMFSSVIWGLFGTDSSFDYIIVSTPPLLIGISAWILSKFKKADFILDIRDLWPDCFLSGGYISKRNLVYYFGKKLENFLYKRARLITCVSKPMSDYLSGFRNGKSRAHVIYNGINSEVLNDKLERETDMKFKEKKKDNEIIITYSGNMGNAQAISTVVEAAEILKSKKINSVRFKLIGGGVKRPGLERKVAKENLENVEFLGPFGKSEASVYMLRSSALIINLKNAWAYSKTIPSKVFDYLYANKPILYGIDGEGKQILGSLPGNIHFKPNNADSLVSAILKLTENYDYYLELSRKNREFLLNKFTRRQMVDKLCDLIKDIE